MFGVRPGLHAQYYLFGTRSNNGQGKAFFGFGDVTGGYSLVQYNRILTLSTLTESSNSNFTTGGKLPQGFSCFSNYTARYYIFCGYVNPGLDTNTNYQNLTSNTSGTISSTWGNPARRGGFSPAAYLGVQFDAGVNGYNQVWYGGYSDNTGLYYGNGNYLTTYTETGGALTSLSYTSHVGCGFSSYQKAYLVGGINGGGNLSVISSRDWATGTIATNGADNAAGYWGYSVCNWGYGYRWAGQGSWNYANTLRYNFYNETSQTGAALPSTQAQFGGVTSADNVYAYLWTGYQSATLNRFLNLYSWSTSTVSSNSYTTADTNNGWIYGTAGV